MKYDLNKGVLIITAHGEEIRLYHTYFVWEKSLIDYRYSDAPEGMLRSIWDAKWPYRQLRDRILAKTVGFDFEKAFKRPYTWHKS